MTRSRRSPASVMSDSQRLSFKKLREAVIANRFSSVEKTLKYLSSEYNDYLSYYAFVYDTQSIQPSTYQLPRAIVFGDKADFVFSFNSNIPGHDLNDSNAIEMIEFEKATSSFELHEIEFVDNSSDKKRFHGQPYLISESNPDKCLQCHSDGSLQHHWQISATGHQFDLTIHPNWKTYFFWPGVYGSLDDNLIGQGRRRLDAFKDKDNHEGTEYAKFISSNGGNRWQGRYQYLPKLNDDLYGAVNFQLTDGLMNHNMNRIGAILKTKAALLKPYRYSLFVPFACMWQQKLSSESEIKASGTSYANYVSKKIALPLDLKNRLAVTFNTAVSRCSDELVDAEKNIVEPDGLKIDDFKSENIVSSSILCRDANLDMPVAMAFAKWAGIDPDNWAMNAIPGGRRFMDDTAAPLYLARALLLNLFDPSEYQDVNETDPARASYYGADKCDEAIKKAATVN
jgi:hypothetical protein